MGEVERAQGHLWERIEELRARGRGYLEIPLPGSEFPVLTLGLRHGHAVVHLFQDAEKVSLLVGDGSVPPDAAAEIPIMDDLAEFTGDFVLSVDRACAVARTFVRTGTAEGLGQWCDLQPRGIGAPGRADGRRPSGPVRFGRPASVAGRRPRAGTTPYATRPAASAAAVGAG